MTSKRTPSGRQKKQTVKTAKGRKKSSTRWLQRQLNDPYVAEAQRLGYRSRAIFKLIQLDEKLKILKPGVRVVDLGAAPGGWTQLAVQKSKPDKTGAKIVGLDILPMDDIAGAVILEKDFTDDDAPDVLKEALDGEADVVMSDMAAPTTGHRQTDHLRIMGLVEMAYDFARDVLALDGTFLCKVFQGGAEDTLLTLLKKEFKTVRHIKPDASRKESAETYLVATGFKGKTNGTESNH